MSNFATRCGGGENAEPEVKATLTKDGRRMVGRNVGMRKESLNAIEFCLWGRCGGGGDIVRGRRTKANGDKSDIEERN